MSNYQLVNGVDTLAVTVLDASGLHGFETRGSLETSPSEVAYLRGDGVDVVQPITATVLIEATTEKAARAKLRAVVAFAATAEYVRRVGQNSWRALHGSGLSLLSFDPEVIEGGTSGQWAGQIALLPIFALWTQSETRTQAGYQAEVDAESVSP